jgi:hypothetical protein
MTDSADKNQPQSLTMLQIRPEWVTCGTKDTPPCPLADFQAERAALILQLAGGRADRRKIEDVAVQVDRYLITAVHGLRVLLHNTQAPSPDQTVPHLAPPQVLVVPAAPK